MTAFCVVWIGMHDVKPSLIKPRDCMQRWGILSFVHNNVLLRPGVSTRKQHWFKEKFIRAPTGIDTEQRGRRTLAAPSFHINKESWDRYRAPLLDAPPPSERSHWRMTNTNHITECVCWSRCGLLFHVQLKRCAPPLTLSMCPRLFDGQDHWPDHACAKWQKCYHQQTADGGQHSYGNATEASEKRGPVVSEALISAEDGAEPEQTYLVLYHVEISSGKLFKTASRIS